jgi:hypothetical protein
MIREPVLLVSKTNGCLVPYSIRSTSNSKSKVRVVYSLGRTFALSVFPSGPSQILYSSDPFSNLT